MMSVQTTLSGTLDVGLRRRRMEFGQKVDGHGDGAKESWEADGKGTGDESNPAKLMFGEALGSDSDSGLEALAMMEGSRYEGDV